MLMGLAMRSFSIYLTFPIGPSARSALLDDLPSISHFPRPNPPNTLGALLPFIIHKTMMGKEKVDKKEKKEKKEKRSEKDGVHKREKKEKREKKLNGHATEEVMTVLGAGESEIIVLKSNGESNIKSERILGALVPFANPLADDKVGKKVLKAVKKGTI